ncbi:hypothetical protein F5B17DRAFT_422796 [Nemania serpens]|nr:hypothetical protein F5B17DRAFT_422796 [Nemania serpens]
MSATILIRTPLAFSLSATDLATGAPKKLSGTNRLYTLGNYSVAADVNLIASSSGGRAEWGVLVGKRVAFFTIRLSSPKMRAVQRLAWPNGTMRPVKVDSSFTTFDGEGALFRSRVAYSRRHGPGLERLPKLMPNRVVFLSFGVL